MILVRSHQISDPGEDRRWFMPPKSKMFWHLEMPRIKNIFRCFSVFSGELNV